MLVISKLVTTATLLITAWCKNLICEEDLSGDRPCLYLVLFSNSGIVGLSQVDCSLICQAKLVNLS